MTWPVRSERTGGVDLVHRIVGSKGDRAARRIHRTAIKVMRVQPAVRLALEPGAGRPQTRQRGAADGGRASAFSLALQHGIAAQRHRTGNRRHATLLDHMCRLMDQQGGSRSRSGGERVRFDDDGVAARERPRADP